MSLIGENLVDDEEQEGSPVPDDMPIRRSRDEG